MFVCSHLQRTMSTQCLKIIAVATTMMKHAMNYLLDDNEKGDSSMIINARARNKVRHALFYVVTLQMCCADQFLKLLFLCVALKSANAANANHAGTFALILDHLLISTDEGKKIEISL